MSTNPGKGKSDRLRNSKKDRTEVFHRASFFFSKPVKSSDKATSQRSDHERPYNSWPSQNSRCGGDEFYIASTHRFLFKCLFPSPCQKEHEKSPAQSRPRSFASISSMVNRKRGIYKGTQKSNGQKRERQFIRNNPVTVINDGNRQQIETEDVGHDHVIKSRRNARH